MRRFANPLTAVGMLTLALAVVGYVAGWQLGWIELVVLAGACALALVIALPFVVGRMRLEVERGLAAERIKVGELGRATFEVRNPRSTPLRSRNIEDLVTSGVTDQTGQRTLRVPTLGPGETATIHYDLPPLPRGKYQVGPAVIARADPLQLMRREVRHTGHDTLWVHPRYDAVRPLPVGFAKDLEGPTSDTSPIGDVAFHSLREYQPGDDFRHIHWMSTARANKPMVRHYVDNRRPYLAVLLDTRAGVASPVQFELAVEVTASMAVSSLQHREPVAVWAGDRTLLGKALPGGRDDVLDRLALVRQRDDRHDGTVADPLAVATSFIRNEPGVSALAFVTGSLPSAELIGFARQLRRKVRVIVVRVWPLGLVRSEALPGARTVDIDTRKGFAAAWETVAR